MGVRERWELVFTDIEFQFRKTVLKTGCETT